MKVWTIPGEHALRYHVESRSDPQNPHLVDLAAHDGYGMCDCKRWQCVIWPAVRDRTHRRHVRKTTCAHVRAALFIFLDIALAAWIKEFGKDAE